MFKKISPYLLLTPALIFLITFLVYPMINTIYLSFWDYSYFTPDDKAFIGIQNYIELFMDEGFRASISFSLMFTFACLILELLFGLGIALILRRIIRFGTIIRTIAIFPYMIAPIATGQIWRLMFNLDFGIVNYVLNVFSLDSVNWLGSNTGAFFAVVIAQVWKSTPFVMLVLLSGLQSIPEEVYEAAVVDGANPWRSFWHITLPLLTPSITIAMVFETIFKLRVFDLVITLTGGGPGKVTTPLGVLLQRSYFQTYEAGYSGAISVVLLTFGMIFSFIYIALVTEKPRKRVRNNV
jgi:multiple sugar transport system permease protein